MPSGKLSQSFLWALLGSYNFFIHPFLGLLFFFVRNLYFFPLVFNPSAQEPLQTALNLTHNRAERWQLYQSIQKPNSLKWKWQFCKWNQLLPKHDQKQVLKATQTEIYFWSPTYFEGLLPQAPQCDPVPALRRPHVVGDLQKSPQLVFKHQPHVLKNRLLLSVICAAVKFFPFSTFYKPIFQGTLSFSIKGSQLQIIIKNCFAAFLYPSWQAWEICIKFQWKPDRPLCYWQNSWKPSAAHKRQLASFIIGNWRFLMLCDAWLKHLIHLKT